MTHGDDSGLVLPPRIAPVPGRHRADSARQLAGNGAAEGARDSATSWSPVDFGSSSMTARPTRRGGKFAEWELRGVPLRLEIGPKDIEKSQVLIARRDTRESSRCRWTAWRSRPSRALLDEVQRNLFQRAVALPRGARSASRSSRHSNEVMEGAPASSSPLVRVGRVRGADQDGHAGDDSQHADGVFHAVGPLRPLRSGSRGRAWFAKAYWGGKRSGIRLWRIPVRLKADPRQVMYENLAINRVRACRRLLASPPAALCWRGVVTCANSLFGPFIFDNFNSIV